MKRTLRACLLAGMVFGGSNGFSHAQLLARAGRMQRSLEPSAPATTRTLRSALTTLKSQYRVDILFESRTIDNLLVPVANPQSDGSVEGVLSALLRPVGLTYRKVKDRAFIIVSDRNDTKSMSAEPLRYGPAMPLTLGKPTPMVATSQLIMPSLTQVIDRTIRGTVRDSTTAQALPGVSVVIKGTQRGTTTDADGNYKIDVPDAGNPVLVFSYIGFNSQEVTVGSQANISLDLGSTNNALSEVIVVGYGTQKKESLTGAVSNITNKDIENVHVATTSSALAGKLPGVTFRQAEGRPGSSALLQIRGMGDPLYVIDGIQKDAGQFNNIAPADIESISILKDASASVYGSRAANGVILVTTKRGKTGNRNTVSVDSYYGVQNWTRFPKGVNAYDWMLGKADAEVNQTGSTSITPDELAKWKQGTELGYKSFDWRQFVVGKDAPQYQVNVNASGGSERINYYFSVTRLNQDAVFKDYNFNRTNIQSNIDAKIADRLKVGVQINGRIETRQNPGVPGGDDYWAPRFALFRNRPTERPYANDNPLYPANIGHNDTNWGLQNYDISGYWKEDWRVLQANFTAEYQLPIKGLTARGLYSYYIADRLMNGHEYTYNVYGYDPVTNTYPITGGSSNPWRERGTTKVLENVMQGQLTYANSFGRHSVGGTFVTERISRRTIDTWLHSVPKTNALPLLQFADMDTYNDNDYEEARLGYVGRLTYNYADKYFFEVAGRRDASWKFEPDRRWGFFPSMSAGWRITEESFFKNLGQNVVSDLKLRGSYGKLGDDNVGIGSFDYLPGYNYATSTVILDGTVVKGARNRGVPINNISWFTSTITDIGLDYGLFNNKLTGSVDYFYRKREGLRGRKYDVLVPNELGYSLPDENVNSDARVGGEIALAYNTKIRDVGIRIATNASYSRGRDLQQYKPRFANSWDYYRNSQLDRYSGIFWGQQVIGQFQSQDQINNYPVNVDGQGNKTLLPGDFIYKDVNGDGKIDGYDQRPIGYPTGQVPIINFGFNLAVTYKGFDLQATFSGGSMYAFNQNWEMRWPYQNGGNLLAEMYNDRWHREDPFNLDSPWIPGKNPPLRFNNGGHSNYNQNSDWWLINLSYLRLRTAEVGYSLPASLISKLKLQRVRVYVNTLNLFSIDNIHQIGLDPEVWDENGLQYPQSKFVNAGINLSF